MEVKSLDELSEALDNNPRVLVEFGASWCAPCHRFLPHLQKFAAQHPDVVCMKVDVEQVEGVANAFQLPPSVPQVYYFVDGAFARDVKGRTIIQLNKELGE